MRVITGSARGRRLGELEGMETRPTTDRVKEGLFNIIQFDIEGRKVLDLFAGTGQLGIEALSRGAKSALFVDKRADAVKLVRENLALCHLEENAQVICGDSLAALGTQSGRFDIIFLDPPYNKGYGEALLPLLSRPLAEGGIILFEHSRDEAFPEEIGGLKRVREYRYGKTLITTYAHADEVSAE